MAQGLRHLRAITFVALLLQMIAPVSSAHMLANALDHGTLLCASSGASTGTGTASAEARAANRALLNLLEEDAPLDDCAQHCANYILSQKAELTWPANGGFIPATAAEPAPFPARQISAPAFFPRSAPLGLRAPPVSG